MYSVSASARQLLQDRGRLSLNCLEHSASLYHENVFSLFDAEFYPALRNTGTSRSRDGSRPLGYEHALAQNAAYILYTNLGPVNIKQADTFKLGNSFEPAYDVCLWLPMEREGHERRKPIAVLSVR